MAITPQQRIQIKRRNSVPASAEGWAYLLDGELGYVKNENGLYIGLGDGRSAVKVNINSWDELKDKVNATISSDGLMSAADKKKLDNTNVAYGTCSTAASTAQKNIVITSQGDWSLQIGSIIVVKFTNTNTANNPVFKVGNAAAKSIWYNTALISTSNLSYAGYANRPSMYMYDGTQFVWLGWTIDSDTKVTQSAAITTAGEYPVLLGYSTATTSVTNTVNKAAAFTYNPNTKILTANTFKGALTGNADTATKLKTARTISLTGDATGSASFDGSANASITVTVADDSHNHIISNIDSLQTVLNAKAELDKVIQYINAGSADYDMDTILKSGTHRKWYFTNKSTLGTPFAKGKTTLQVSLILSFASSTTYGVQVAFASGGTIWIRKLNDGTISEWGDVYSSINKPTLSELGAAPAVHTHEYLPLTGGAKMTGSIYKTTNTGGISLGGGTEYANGSALSLYGKDSTSYTGAFILRANNGTNSMSLYGTPAGSLTWGGKEIYTTGNKPTPADIGAAAASHNHSASNITSGTLAIARGGTGITSNPSMLINLGSTTAASVFAASPRPGITGTLGVGNGGTGHTTAKDAANAFINALEEGTSKPADGDYYISQYVNGGTKTTTYHRRSISKLWEYMKDKIDDLYLPLTGGTLTGTLTVPGIIAATPGSGAIGQSGKPFLNMHSRNFIMYDENNIQIAKMYTNVAAGTTTSVGTSYLVLGNNKKSNVAGNAKGYLGLYSNNDKFVQLTAADGMTSSKTITLPDAGGTVALAEKTLPLTGGTLTGALTISADGLNVTGMAKFNNVTNFFGGGYTRLYSSSSQLQLEAWASNTTTSTETMTRAVLALYPSSNLDQSVRFLKYDAGSGSTYYLYGTHNITKGTDPITAKKSKLETNCIYLQYE